MDTKHPDMTTPQPWDGEEPAAVAAARKRANRRTLAILAAVGLGMFGFAFANVPLFNLLCQKLGIAQGIGVQSTGLVVGEDDNGEGRALSVHFLGTVSGQLPVEFRPRERMQHTRTDKWTVNDYEFLNLSNRTVYMMPTHFITPTSANNDRVFSLGECFCYDAMKLEPRQRLSLPVAYRFADVLEAGVGTVSMHYTLFPITREEYERRTAESEAGTAAAHTLEPEGAGS